MCARSTTRGPWEGPRRVVPRVAPPAPLVPPAGTDRRHDRNDPPGPRGPVPGDPVPGDPVPGDAGPGRPAGTRTRGTRAVATAQRVRAVARGDDRWSAVDLLRRAAHSERQAGHAPRRGPRLQGPVPSLQDDEGLPRPAPRRLGLPRLAGRARGRETARV